MKSILTTMCLCATCIFAQAQFQYTFEVGDRYNFTFTVKQVSIQTLLGTDQRIESLLEGEYVMEIDSITVSGARTKLYYIRLKNTMRSAESSLEMDSEAVGGKAENKIFKAMMNKPFHLFMNKQGSIEKLEDVEKLWSDFNQTGLDERVLTQMRLTLEQLMGGEVLKSTFEQGLVVYPAMKIQPGDTWTVSSGAPINFSVTAQSMWTLAAVTDTTAVLNAHGVYRTNKDEIVTLTSGVRAKTDLSGMLVVKGVSDVKSGWPKQLSTTSDLSGWITLLAGSITNEDMDIPMKITIETAYSIRKVN